jgi:hypothetical protein
VTRYDRAVALLTRIAESRTDGVITSDQAEMIALLLETQRANIASYQRTLVEHGIDPIGK